jgi:hypothetical protein
MMRLQNANCCNADYRNADFINANYHRWASASVKLTPASAFRHPSSQSGTAVKKCRTASFYSGTGSVSASLVFFSPVPDCLDAGQSGIPVVSIAVVSIAVPVVSIAVVSIAGVVVVSIAEPHHRSGA